VHSIIIAFKGKKLVTAKYFFSGLFTDALSIESRWRRKIILDNKRHGQVRSSYYFDCSRPISCEGDSGMNVKLNRS
jgi:hypothetical protein